MGQDWEGQTPLRALQGGQTPLGLLWGVSDPSKQYFGLRSLLEQYRTIRSLLEQHWGGSDSSEQCHEEIQSHHSPMQ